MKPGKRCFSIVVLATGWLALAATSMGAPPRQQHDIVHDVALSDGFHRFALAFVFDGFFVAEGADVHTSVHLCASPLEGGEPLPELEWSVTDGEGTSRSSDLLTPYYIGRGQSRCEDPYLGGYTFAVHTLCDASPPCDLDFEIEVRGPPDFAEVFTLTVSAYVGGNSSEFDLPPEYVEMRILEVP